MYVHTYVCMYVYRYYVCMYYICMHACMCVRMYVYSDQRTVNTAVQACKDFVTQITQSPATSGYLQVITRIKLTLLHYYTNIRITSMGPIKSNARFTIIKYERGFIEVIK
jgi:hypothetical protein